MKKLISLVLMVVVVMSLSSCNSVDGMLQDSVGTLNAVRSSITTPMADKAQARDARVSGKQVARYHAEQAGRFAAFNSRKEQ